MKKFTDTFTDKYMHVVFAVYSLVVFSGYVDLQIKVNLLEEYQRRHTIEYKEHVSTFVVLKEERIKDLDIISFIRTYRDKQQFSLFKN